MTGATNLLLLAIGWEGKLHRYGMIRFLCMNKFTKVKNILPRLDSHS